MPLGAGTRLGPYEIQSAIGAGGMGEVYRARDTKLDRLVAIKVLPDAVVNDPDRIARFEREAKTLAALNHPHIAQIYGVEESGTARGLVMELVDGETLADRIARGRIPLDEALPIARQIAEALEAAHEQGIIHRDLKPANIKVTPSGAVKVLDFGLAKLIEAGSGIGDPGSESARGALSVSPTITSPALMTGVGVLLGTAAYMSPEQAKGREADRRSDIWAFGCVLFEMLTGTRAFGGEDVTDVLVAVLSKEPAWDALPAKVPIRVPELLQRCLEKDVRKRRRDAGDLRLDLEAAPNLPVATTTVVAPGRQPRLAWGLAAVATVALASLAVVHFRESTPASPPEMRVDITTPATPWPLDFALSPDGRSIAFVASGQGQQRLWVRALDQSEAQPLPGTEDAAMPFWSADSRAIGYFASGKLHRIDARGGPPQPLASAAPRGGAWNANGTILFAPTATSPILRISSSGGAPVAVTRLDTPQQAGHFSPQFLPDGVHFLFFVRGSPEVAGVYLGSLDGTEVRKLALADSTGAWLPPDWVVFQRQTSLLAQRVDLSRGEGIGDVVRIADLGAYPTALGQGAFSVSGDGRIAFRAGVRLFDQLVWHDRAGRRLASVGEPEGDAVAYPELSPNGQRVAVFRAVQSNMDVWIYDLARAGLSRFTFDPAIDTAPVWSPDGTQIAFASSRSGPQGLFVGESNRAGAEAQLLDAPTPNFPSDWSRDGRFLLYVETDSTTGRNLWALPMTGVGQPKGPAGTAAAQGRKPFPVVRTPFEEQNGQFSPDGRWVAYETNESGRFEIVVQQFPSASGKWQVSTGGGIQPRWRADGKELYFFAPDENLMAVSVTTTDGALVAGKPAALFQAHVVPGVGTNKQQYAVSRDGRFLINEPVEESVTAPITLILNWKPPAK